MFILSDVNTRTLSAGKVTLQTTRSASSTPRYHKEASAAVEDAGPNMRWAFANTACDAGGMDCRADVCLTRVTLWDAGGNGALAELDLGGPGGTVVIGYKWSRGLGKATAEPDGRPQEPKKTNEVCRHA